MSHFWKFIAGAIGSIFSPPTDRIRGMDGVASTSGSLIAPNERVASKLKGYFDLAKEEINKAVRAEEWGLPDEALIHYNNARLIFLEAKGTMVPSTISPSEQKKVESYHQKISKWNENVSERLRVLSQRGAVASIEKAPVKLTTKMTNPQDGPSSTALTLYRAPLKNPGFARKSLTAGNQKVNSENVKPVKDSLISGYDANLVEMINTAIVDRSPAVKWDDVAGLEKAKQALLEMVILPTKRRDLFTGLRKPARGLLLFGPPGTGKTMLAKAVASESEATFFNVSASSLTSKWVGEAEKLVRTLFAVAASRQPSVIFMDEIDSLLSARVANENDSSRRLKSEFLVQFDGVTSNQNALVIVIGATNKPQELDDAVLRRLVKRIYIPLPDVNVRRLLLRHQLIGQSFSLPGSELEKLVKETEGYSGSDLQALCEEAAMIPIRELGSQILTINANQVRPLRYSDFKKAMTVIRPSLQRSRWEELERWNREFGSN